MKALLWPMLDNKFLKHPGLGLKIMAPIELTRFIEREDRDFYQRARLDKQNMIASFEWTGEALYDVANARLAACAAGRLRAQLRDFIDEAVDRPADHRGPARPAHAAAPVQVPVPAVRARTATPTSTASRSGGSRRQPSSRRWPCTAATRTPSTAAWGRGDE